MQCPFCSHLIAEHWQKLHTFTDSRGVSSPSAQERIMVHSTVRPGWIPKMIELKLLWTQCHNKECGQVIVQASRTIRSAAPTANEVQTTTETWIAIPAQIEPSPLPTEIPASIRQDYREAELTLKTSPRMSAVLSRRILADLLEKYVKLTQYGLADRIDAFIKDGGHPSSIRKNLHYLREIGNFSAHTMTDSEDKIIDVTSEEAEWTLKVVSSLIDYLIVGPAKDELMRNALDNKLQQGGRKPIKPLPS